MFCTGKEQLTCNSEKMGCEGCFYYNDKNKDEIKVGEYVRTKKQGIRRIDTIFINRTVNKYGYEIGSEGDGKLYSIIKTTDIIKYSKNIIDLVEVGDFINGVKVQAILEGKYEKWLELGSDEDWEKSITINNADIKSIVTKEQFSSIEYRLEN